MPNKKNSKSKTYKISRRNSKSGKSVTVTESQLKSAKKAAKKIYKQIPKNKRLIVSLIAFIVVAGFIYLFDVTVMPLKYISTIFNVPTIEARGENNLRVHFLDVGQGDSIIIEFPDNTNMIIDGGDKSTDVYTKIIRYAKGLNIKTFDYMMLTHTDSDHVGGLDNVIDYFDIKKIYMPYIQEGVTVTAAYSEFLKLAKAENAELEISNFGDEIISTDTTNSFIFALLSPEDKDNGEYKALNEGLSSNTSNLAEEKNNVSPIVLLEYLNVKIMFTGDVNESSEIAMLERVNDWNSLPYTPFTVDEQDYYINLDVDLLKVSHHGSSGSSCNEFLAEVKPEYAVISVGEGNSYNHPHAETLSRLSSYVSDNNLYRTDINGDIIATISPTQQNTKGNLEVEGETPVSSDTSQNNVIILKLTLIPYDKFKAIAA
jgi:competence protein ComEC